MRFRLDTFFLSLVTPHCSCCGRAKYSNAVMCVASTMYTPGIIDDSACIVHVSLRIYAPRALGNDGFLFQHWNKKCRLEYSSWYDRACIHNTEHSLWEASSPPLLLMLNCLPDFPFVYTNYINSRSSSTLTAHKWTVFTHYTLKANAVSMEGILFFFVVFFLAFYIFKF